MKNLQMLWLANSDQPRGALDDRPETEPNAQVDIDYCHGGVTICSKDPGALFALARVLDEAAVKLAAAKDARAARDMNQAVPA
jgi:hypothetical protein